MSHKRNNHDQEMVQIDFKKCPCCGTNEITKFDYDFFCLKCDWDSIELDVSTGNFERRIQGFGKQNMTRPIPSVVQTIEEESPIEVVA